MKRALIALLFGTLFSGAAAIYATGAAHADTVPEATAPR